MLYSPILGAWHDYLWLIFVGATVIGSWISNAKKNANKQRQIDERMGSQDLEQVAARRREQLRQTSQQRTQANLSGGTPGGDAGPGNMTMAERIARARAKAQYEQRGQSGSAQVDSSGRQVPNEAQRRALEQRRAELERRREAAAQQQRARQQRAQQQAQAQQRAQQQKLARQQQAQAHSRAQQRARRSGKLIHERVAVPEPTSSSPRRLVPSKPKPKPAAVQPVLIEEPGDIVAGELTRNDLRRAIIMNEVLGKPLALRDTAGW